MQLKIATYEFEITKAIKDVYCNKCGELIRKGEVCIKKYSYYHQINSPRVVLYHFDCYFSHNVNKFRRIFHKEITELENSEVITNGRKTH